MREVRTKLLLLVGLGCMSAMGQAAPDGGGQSNVVRYMTDIGPGHHPVGRPLPPHAEFSQPTGRENDVWFFDLNHNGMPERGEPRLFGPLRVIECGSCHADSPDAKSEAAASVFLRQDARVLCLICHRL